MKKKLFSHYLNIKAKAALPLVLLVMSAMLLDAANLPFVTLGKDVLSGGKTIIEVKSKLERIYGVVDMPVKIANAMFEKNSLAPKPLTDVLQETIMSEVLYSTLRAGKPFERAVFEKVFAVTLNQSKKQPFDLQSCFIQNYFFAAENSFLRISKYEIKLIFLFLILRQSYPRDIPSSAKNQKNL